MGKFNMVVFDNDDNEIAVGTKVCIYDDAPAYADESGQNWGAVVSISDFDADVDDDTLRTITITPRVTVEWVKFVSGKRVRFRDDYATSEWQFDEYDMDDDGCPQSCDATGKCEDLVVVLQDEV
jgi:hypothetical protein